MTHDYDVLLTGDYFCDLIFTGLPGMPQLGSEIFGTGFEMLPGAVFNIALAFQRLGLHAGWAGDFGDDFFSRFVLEEARRAGLDSSLFRLHPYPVRRVSAALSFPHDRSFVSYVDPIDPTSPIPLIERHRPRCLLLSHLQFGPQLIDLAAAARAAGALIYMDCQAGQATLATPGVVEALQAVDIFAPNSVEALHLTGCDTVEDALARLAALTPLVIVKCGATGVLARTGERTLHVPALPVDAVDTTAAGDCFNAGFLYGYLRGESLEISLRCGNICGGLSTTARGGTATPSAAQVEEWLRHYPPTP